MSIPNSWAEAAGRLLQILQRHESQDERVLHYVWPSMTDPIRRQATMQSDRSSLARARSSAPRSSFSEGLLGSSRYCLEHCDRRVALKPEGEALSISGGPPRKQPSRELPRRHRRAEARVHIVTLTA